MIFFSNMSWFSICIIAAILFAATMTVVTMGIYMAVRAICEWIEE